MKEKVAFQTIAVPYPKVLYAGGIIIKHDILFFPFTKMHKSLADLKKYANEVVIELEKRFKSRVDIKRQLFVMKVKLVRKYPLKKKMWDIPDFRLPNSARSLEFVRAMGRNKLYNLIVTPVLDEKTKSKVTEYVATFPYIKTSEESIDMLMQTSDIFVSPEAKHAGIYFFDKIWTTGF